MIESIFEKIVLILLATPGITAPAATATKPTINAYSMRSCPFVSIQTLNIKIRRFIFSSVSPEASGPVEPAARPGDSDWLAGCDGHDRSDFRKDRADASCNARHNRAGRDGHKTHHQCVFDEVLSTRILQNSQLQNEVLHICFVSPSLECATGFRRYVKLSSSTMWRNQVLCLMRCM